MNDKARQSKEATETAYLWAAAGVSLAVIVAVVAL
jgi:hypothetical protein